MALQGISRVTLRVKLNLISALFTALQGISRVTLRAKLTILISALFIIPLAIENMYITRWLSQEYYRTSASRVMDIARLVAANPDVLEEFATSAESVSPHMMRHLDMIQRLGNVAFITLMDMDGVRLYHPNREQIGRKFAGGDEGRALQGESYISTAQGTLGISQRAFVPVRDKDGKQLGAVSVGILSDAIDVRIASSSRPLQQMLLVALAVGICFTIVITRSIKNILFGLEPVEVAKLLEERNAILRIVNDGIIAVDPTGRVSLVNDEARRILRKAGVAESLAGKALQDVMPEAPLASVLKTGLPDLDHPMNLNDVPVLTSLMPLVINGATVGAIATFRDMSDVRKMSEEITGINRYADALRSQSHEFMNRLHAIFGLADTGTLEDIKHYVGGIIEVKHAEIGGISKHIHDPVLAGFLVSKYSAAHERGVSLSFDLEGTLPAVRHRPAAHGLITILGNLIDNAIDAVQATRHKRITVTFRLTPHVLDLAVTDTGEGMMEKNASVIFSKGYSTKGKDRGLGLWLVIRTVDEMDGTITMDSASGQGTSIEISLPAQAFAGD